MKINLDNYKTVYVVYHVIEETEFTDYSKNIVMMTDYIDDASSYVDKCVEDCSSPFGHYFYYDNILVPKNWKC